MPQMVHGGRLIAKTLAREGIDYKGVLYAGLMLTTNGPKVLEFNAPSEPGDYEFICTFPGHHILMRGIMKVVK